MNYIKFLGSNGAKSATKGALSVQIDERSVIDAGNIIVGLADRAYMIDKIFLTHSHFDHISDIPFLVEERLSVAETSLEIYGTKESLNLLHKFIFNGEIWPDFREIKLLKSSKKSVEFIEIEPDREVLFKNFSITAIKTNHSKGSCGYVVKREGNGIFITSDTYVCDEIWDRVNQDNSIHSLCIDISFPSEYAQLARESKHLTPKLLKSELKKLKRDITIYPIHLKPLFYNRIVKEIEEFKILRGGGKIVQDGDVIYFRERDGKKFFHQQTGERADTVADKMYDVAVALSTQKDTKKLLKMILSIAKEITDADGGTIYMLNEKESLLEFAVVVNESLELDIDSNRLIDWKPLPLYDRHREPNRKMVAVVSAVDKRVINIDDVYFAKEFDFSGTREFDRKTGYRSKSMLVIPLSNHEDRVVGVLQLINKIDKIGSHQSITSFDKFDEKITLALASMAGSAITKDRLIKGMERLFEKFLDTINVAIEKKSKFTAGHIQKTVIITMMIMDAINRDKTTFRDKRYTKEELQEIKFATLMHDIGKIGIPEYIMSKATKLQSLYDKIDMVECKSHIRKKELLISYLKSVIEREGIDFDFEKLYIDKSYINEIRKIDEEMEFLRWANRGRENFRSEDRDRVFEISKAEIDLDGVKVAWLGDDEVENLSIRRGTLNSYEKRIMESHAKIGAEILETLPFPKKYSKVPSIATAHHEKLDGSGYPKGLKEEEIPFEAKVLAIADIFEALTAKDRPYKKAKSVRESMRILSSMADNGYLDKELIDFLYKDGLYLKIEKALSSVSSQPQSLSELKVKE